MVSDDEKTAAEHGRSCELSPGEILLEGRERAGLTQEQVAKELYMTLTKVRALESDDYRHMGPDTFIRGYLRSYASLIKLDVGQVLSAYDRHAQNNASVQQVVPSKQEPASKPLWQFVALIVSALLVVWLISVWFFDNRKKPDYAMPATVIPPSTTIQNLDEVASSENSSSMASQIATNDIQNAAVTSEAHDATSAAAVSSPSASESSSASSATPITDAAKLDRIVFAFAEECWLEVSDSRGDVLVTDLQPAGSRLTLQGVAPFDVKLGNAPATEIELNNEKVAVVPALGTNVLSLKVDKSTNQ